MFEKKEIRFAYEQPTEFNQVPVYDAPIEFKLYKKRGRWVFDDERTGLVAEALVMGTDKIIDHLLEVNGVNADEVTFMMQDGTVCAESGYAVYATYHKTKSHPLLGSSHWYKIITEGVKGVEDENGNQLAWLCPNIHRYYMVAPKALAFWIKPNA